MFILVLKVTLKAIFRDAFPIISRLNGRKALFFSLVQLKDMISHYSKLEWIVFPMYKGPIYLGRFLIILKFRCANRKSKMCSILPRHTGTLVHRTNHSFTLWRVWYPIYPLYSRMNPLISTGRDSYIIEKRNLFFWNFFPNQGFTNNKNRCRLNLFSLMLGSKLVTGDCKPVK